MTADGSLLFVPNRGHNSIASFKVDAATGTLTAAGRAATEAVPSAFSLDPQGRFVFGAGSATGPPQLPQHQRRHRGDDAPSHLRRGRPAPCGC